MLSSLLLAALLVNSAPVQDVDLRDAYDVQAYGISLKVFPETKTIRGLVTIDLLVGDEPLETFVCDLWSGDEKQAGLKVEGIHFIAPEITLNPTQEYGDLEFTHSDDQIWSTLPDPIPAGTRGTFIISYSGTPGHQDNFTGFHWEKTADGSPWIGTSCQGTGAHWWWPCKSSFYNPDDKPESVSMTVSVPKGLYAVSNGRLTSRQVSGEEGEQRETFKWHNPYGCETYAVTLNIAPYVVVETPLNIQGIEEPVPFIYYVLPENAEKAAVQFTQVPELIAIYSEAFGPYPFPEAKVGLVETSFWGMEHSTAVAYGSTYPLWCQQNDAPDRYASRNKFFDYILVHEVAHEWWGNAVSAETWGHFWIHEGFGTYAEGVYVEKTQGREAADRYFAQIRENPNSNQTLYRGDDKTSGEAYTGLIYSKGALVLNTLRHYVNDENAWWKSLRDFNMEARGGNAKTEDFQMVLERNTGRKWDVFFAEWFYGPGLPTLTGSVTTDGEKLVIDIDNPTDGGRSFHIPLHIQFKLNGQESSFRIELEPGENKREMPIPGGISDISLPHLDRVAGKHSVEVKG